LAAVVAGALAHGVILGGGVGTSVGEAQTLADHVTETGVDAIAEERTGEARISRIAISIPGEVAISVPGEVAISIPDGIAISISGRIAISVSCWLLVAISRRLAAFGRVALATFQLRHDFAYRRQSAAAEQPCEHESEETRGFTLC
jgi:hypothetical protein